jgi:hypothetical protein
MGVFAVINLIFMFLSWKWSMEAFEKGYNFGGWVNLFASALNAAVVASIIF